MKYKTKLTKLQIIEYLHNRSNQLVNELHESIINGADRYETAIIRAKSVEVYNILSKLDLV